MGDKLKFPNEKPLVYGKCSCGCEQFKFIMSHADHDRVGLVECAGCHATAPLLRDDEMDIECLVDQDDP